MRATWEEIKNQIGVHLSKNSFSLWISPITFLRKEDHTVTLGCPNKFSRNWVMEHYLDLIQDGLHKAGAGPVDVVLKIEPRKKRPLPPEETTDSKQLVLPNLSTNGSSGNRLLKRDFTFDRFVVGACNEFAFSASKALAQGGPWNYHSLLMLANTGLGKTHLSQAVANWILAQNPHHRVRYVTAEDFTNEMVSSLKSNSIEAFKDKYRRCCDVLLLEEVHFLSGKEKTQLELEHTLDALANDNKKVLFTSALPPKDIPRMSKGLSSRLASGLVTTIGGPDYQTRVKILKNKAAEKGITLSDEIVHFLSASLRRDIRQIESALTCLKAKAELLNARIDIDLARDVVKCLVNKQCSATPENIKQLICKYYKVEPDLLRSKSRKKVHAYPRNIYIYLCRQYTDETLEHIAETINRSHSTVLYASETVEHKMKTDPKIKHQVEFLGKQIQHLNS